MEGRHYYHMFANGDDARNFITSEREFQLAFNRFAVCHVRTGVCVLSFSVEDSHPHCLLWGALQDCLLFKKMYEDMSLRSIIQGRGSKDGVILHCELVEVDTEDYLMNVASYTIVQATKDGKAVMPYDYLYGTGALYFRSPHTILPWYVDNNGNYVPPVRYGDLSYADKLKLSGSRFCLPDEWMTCNGFIIPTNYVDVKRFENIYRTHNCFRAFLCSGKKKDEEIRLRMADARGVIIDDLQARELCRECCVELFQRNSTKYLTIHDRVALSMTLRTRYHLSPRQIATLVHIPETEIRKYIR